MRLTKFVRMVMLVVTASLGSSLAAQVQTEVPPVVPGAKQVSVERIKVPGGP